MIEQDYDFEAWLPSQKRRSKEELIGYVYLIDYGDGKTFKIGQTTKEPEQRLSQISRGSVVMPMHLVMASGAVSNCSYIESLLHMRFDHKRVRGEWFKLEFDDLIAIYQCFKALTIDLRTRVYDRWYELVPEGFEYPRCLTRDLLPFLTKRERFDCCLWEVQTDLSAARRGEYGRVDEVSSQ